MTRHATFVLLLALFVSDALAQTPRDATRFDPSVELKPANSFESRATVRDTSGAQKTVVLTIRNWIIPNRQQVPAFPDHGLLVIQVRAGSLTTIIDSKRQKRGVDEFWTVPPGTTMGIETDEDSVILQVVSLRE